MAVTVSSAVWSLSKTWTAAPDVLLDWYGVKPPKEIRCIKYHNSNLCQVGIQRFLANENEALRLINSDAGRLISLTNNKSEIYLVTDNKVEIFTPNFELIDSLNIAEELSATALAATYSENGLIIHTTEQNYLLDFDSFEFEPLVETDFPAQHIQTKLPYELQESTLKNSLGQAYRTQQISYLKIIEDFHSGQILALQGKLLIDVVGIIILLLAISGVVAWQRKKKIPVQYKVQINYQTNSIAYEYADTQVCILNSQVIEPTAFSPKSNT